MLSEQLQKIVSSLKDYEQKGLGKMIFPDAATEEQISSFEKENNITFPEQFKEWLMYTDGGECFLPAGVQFYGVVPEHKPTIDVNDNSRPDESYVVIGALANGDPILIKKGENKISIYNLEAGRIEEDEVYDDFFSFLNDLSNLLGIGA